MCCPQAKRPHHQCLAEVGNVIDVRQDTGDENVSLAKDG